MSDIKLREIAKTIFVKPLFPNECKRNHIKNDAFKINQVFCFKIMDNVYVYGSVLNGPLTNCLYPGAIVIEIYDFFSKDIKIEEFLKCNKDILLGPYITYLSVFKQGVLIPLECYYDSNTSYGFFKHKLNPKKRIFERINKVYDEYGKISRRRKKFVSSYAVVTPFGIFYEVFDKILISKNMLVSNKNEFESYRRFIKSKEEA